MTDDIVVVRETPSKTEKYRLSPASSATPLLLAELATVWAQVSREIPGSVGGNHVAIRRFVSWLSDRLGIDATFTVRDIRRRHFDEWEAELLRVQNLVQTDTPYRCAVYLFALLRRLSDDDADAVHPEVYVRVRQPTRVSHIRRESLPDFSAPDRERIQKAVRAVVREARESSRVDGHLMHALHVRLSLATGEPPEVLRRLTIDDVIATPTDAARSAASITELARGAQVDRYAVTYTKNRGGSRYQEVYSRAQHPEAIRALNDLVLLPAQARQAAGQRSLWVISDRSGNAARYTWSLSFKAWLTTHVGEIEGPFDYRRFRKNVVAREAIDKSDYGSGPHRHSERTFFQHYTNSAELRTEAGRRLVGAIDELWQQAVGPTVLTPAGVKVVNVQERLSSPVPGTISPDIAHGALTGCRNPERSPHAALGETCPVSLTGTCFTCSNAVVTSAHLPATVLLNRISHPDFAGDLSTYQENWQDIHTATELILAQFPADQVGEATAHTDEVLLDIKVAGGLRDIE